MKSKLLNTDKRSDERSKNNKSLFLLLTLHNQYNIVPLVPT